MSNPSPKHGMVLPDDDDTVRLTYHRDFPTPAADLWPWISDYDRLASWIGRPEGTASPGATVIFRSTTDRVEPGAPARAESIHIDRCEAPYRLALDWVIPGIPLARIDVHVAEAGHGSILRLTHAMVDKTRAAKIGAGWHYLLDRLDAVREDRPVPRWPGYLDALAHVYALA